VSFGERRTSIIIYIKIKKKLIIKNIYSKSTLNQNTTYKFVLAYSYWLFIEAFLFLLKPVGFSYDAFFLYFSERSVP
jgi:hypothetical protein